MSMNRFTKALAIILTIVLVAPAPLLLAPQRVQAIPVTVVADWTNMLVLIEQAITAIATPISAVAEVAQQINAYVLMPLAFIMSGNLLKMMTASILAFVAGGINGSGAPQFVQSLQGHMQTVGDTQANAFFVQFGKNSNSPFSASITSSLRTNYLQQTSLGGFFAANRNTLPQYTSNQNAYLAGGPGGLGAWFALTTQPQNNPYMLSQRAGSQLSMMVTGATAARSQTLAWGQGMMSWCGEGSSRSTVSTSAIQKVQCFDDENGAETPIKTPASVINAELGGALGSTRAKLQQLGQLGPQVSSILGDISKVMGTIGFANQLLGGSSGGLAGITQSRQGGSVLTNYRNDPGFLGVSQTSVYQNSETLQSSASDKLALISKYETSWNSINASATVASSSVSRLITACSVAKNTPETNPYQQNYDYAAWLLASNAQLAEAQAAFTASVAPVLAKARVAFANIVTARAMVSKVQSGLLSSDTSTQDAAIADLATLQTTPPTLSDFAQAMRDANVSGLAVASPHGSLTVSGGSTVDQMNLLGANAETLLTTTMLTNEQTILPVCMKEAYPAASNSGA